MALTEGRLMGVAREIDATGEEDTRLRDALERLERELRNINATVARKQQLVDDLRASGVEGSSSLLLLSRPSPRNAVASTREGS